MRFKELLKESKIIIEKYEKIHEQIGRIIVDELKDIVPDLRYYATEEGIYFYADEHSACNNKHDYENYNHLFDIIVRALPELYDSTVLYVPNGICFSEEEAKQIEEKLRKLKSKKLHIEKGYRTYNEYLKAFGHKKENEPNDPEEYARKASKEAIKKANKVFKKYLDS